MEERLVFSSTDNLTVNYICLVLKENDIPFTKTIEGAGEYFAIVAGNTFNNKVRIFVSDEDYQRASELITILNKTNEPILIVETPDELKDVPLEEEKEMEEMAGRTKGYFKNFIKYFMIYPVLIYPVLICIIYVIIMSVLQNL